MWCGVWCGVVWCGVVWCGVVCVDPPKGSWKFLSQFPALKGCTEATHALNLKKGVYGLKGAPRAWRIKLGVLLKNGATPLKSDPSIYAWHDKEKRLILVCSTHVDDLKLAGKEHALLKVINALTEAVGKLKIERQAFEHYGIMHRTLDGGSIAIYQNQYIAQLKAVDLPKNVNLESLRSEHDIAAYMSLLGAAAWIVNTRAEVAIFVGALQSVAKSPKYVDLKRLNVILKYIKRHPTETVFKQFDGNLRICAISDSAFKRQDERPLACRGSLITLGTDSPDNPGGKIHVIDCHSKKQKRVTRSTYGAEIHGLADTMELTRVIAAAFTELYQGSLQYGEITKLEDSGSYRYPIDAIVDANSVYDSMVKADLSVPTERSLINILGQMREHMATHRIRYFWWVDTRDMLADGLNKGAISRKALIRALAVGMWNVQHKCIKTHSRLIVIGEAVDEVEVTKEQEPADFDHLVRILVAFTRNLDELHKQSRRMVSLH